MAGASNVGQCTSTSRHRVAKYCVVMPGRRCACLQIDNEAFGWTWQPKSGGAQDMDMEMAGAHINPVQWTHALGVARHTCARVFGHGGTPADAVRLFGLSAEGRTLDWGKAVVAVAERLCTSFPRGKR